MVLEVTTEKGLVYTWVRLLKGIYGLSDREVQVTQAIALRYIQLAEAKNSLKGKAKEEYDVFLKFKTPEVLRSVCSELGVSFIVFREYLKILKSKGVFIPTGLHPDFLPDKENPTIVVALKYGKHS